jgi:hypothetical protein
MRWAAFGLIVIVATAFPVPLASAAAPTGNSGLDQYSETVPGAGGDTPSHKPGGSSSPVRLAAKRELSATGSAGRQTAALAQATAPEIDSKAGDRPSGGPDRRDERGLRTGSYEQPKGSGPGAVLARLFTGDGSDGMGVGLPAILILSMLGAIVAGILRRRRERFD